MSRPWGWPPLPVAAGGSSGRRVQYAALPYRVRRDGEVQIRLITSRETRRWVIPKGWPMKGLSPPKTAARESYEEAGLVGIVSREPIGMYTYEKRLGTRSVLCDVLVFPLKVKRLLEKWPERFQRHGFWFSIDSAAGAVHEQELSELISSFGEIMARRWEAKQLEVAGKAKAKAQKDKGVGEVPASAGPAPDLPAADDVAGKAGAKPATRAPGTAESDGVAGAMPEKAAKPKSAKPKKAKPEKTGSEKAKPEKIGTEKAKPDKARPEKAKAAKAKSGKAAGGRKAEGEVEDPVPADPPVPAVKKVAKGKGGKAARETQAVPEDLPWTGDTVTGAEAPAGTVGLPPRSPSVGRTARTAVGRPAGTPAVRPLEKRAGLPKRGAPAKKAPAAKQPMVARKAVPAKAPVSKGAPKAAVKGVVKGGAAAVAKPPAKGAVKATARTPPVRRKPKVSLPREKPLP